MAQQIKIDGIDIKEGDNQKGHWVNYIITGDDKTKVSTFDHQAASLKVGDTIEAEIELKGKYANIKSFKVLGKAEAPMEHVKPKPPQVNREDMIAQQVAVKAVVELVGYKAIPLNHPLFGAVVNWCWDKLLPDSVKPPMARSGGEPLPETPPPIEHEKSTPPSVKEEKGSLTPTEQLLAKIMEAKGFKNFKTAWTYLINVYHIEDSRINNEPEKVWEEVKERL